MKLLKSYLCSMIIVTGAAGFIASNLVKKLNEERFYDLILVDDFSFTKTKQNIDNLKFTEKINREHFIEWLNKNHKQVQFIFHLGARTDTTEFDISIFEKLNINYSKDIWRACVSFGIPLVYASSAATYGDGSLGYEDKHEIIENLEPLNPYGVSKNEFDKWALKQNKKPYFWAGLKFFNVYGPGESHKGRMASVVFHGYHQIKKTGGMKLFRSHHPDFKDGEQLRDFIYVEDLVNVCLFFLHHRKDSGIYNLGTGVARSFNDLIKATFDALNISENINYIDTPKDIRDKYQYYTKAEMQKLKSIGYKHPFTSLEEGVHKYVSILEKK